MPHDRMLLRQRTLVLLLFLASGSAGLMYQVVWLRMLARTFGVTIHATATVVAAFMAGLALGSYLLGRVIDRRRDPLRVYGLLELAIAGAAIIVPFLLMAAQPLFQAVYRGSAENGALTAAVRVVVSFLVLLVPTTLMGGTLPVLTSFLARRESLFGRNFGLLYGLNTAGAVGGVLLSGFVTIGLLGEWWTIGIGAFVNLAVGGLALSLARRVGEVETVKESVSDVASESVISPYSAGVRRLVLIGFAVSGFTALAYEIVWTRQLILFLRTSVYAFSGMLAVFLTGIALGSLLISRVVDRLRSPLATFAALELVVGLLTAINLTFFVVLDSNFAHRLLGLSSVAFATVFLVLPLTLVFGLIAPVAAVCFAGSRDSSGGAIGRLYSANTVGSILGSLVAGFFLVPKLGATGTVVALAFVNLALAVVFFAVERGVAPIWRGLGLAGALVVTVLLMRVGDQDPFRVAIERRIDRRMGTTWIPDSLAALPNSTKILLHKEGVEATLTAFEINRFPQLWLNGVGMTFLTTATKLMAHLPLATVEDPKEFLAIAFGMGTTVRSASRHEGLSVTAVDLVPETFESFPLFHKDADSIRATGRVKLVANDGRNQLLLSPKQYDVITVDPAPPIWSAGTVNLYSSEFFQLAKSRLTPGGVFCLWFPGGTEEEVRSVLRTFATVFPNGSVWSGPFGWGWYLLGNQHAIDWGRFDQHLAEFYQDPVVMADIVQWDQIVATPAKVKAMFMWTAEEVLAASRQYPIVSDNHPFTEFPLWRYLAGRRDMWHPRSPWLNRPNRSSGGDGEEDGTAVFRDAVAAPVASDPDSSRAGSH